MLNYSVKVGKQEEEYPDISSAPQAIGVNPFPGLRPFSLDECHLFFGREGQVDEILLKLSRNRCVTIMGYSGSGKSSLISCGLVPVLYGGFMTDTSPFWQVVTSRPGASPLLNLAEAIVNQLIDRGRIDKADAHIHRSIIASLLRSSPQGLVEVAKYLQGHPQENIFVLIDQFEELFRYKESATGDEANEASVFVNLILTAVRQSEVPLYIALNMRSDFIGACAAFAGLTQMINNSNYLVPQMTREQKRMAIEGPTAVGGGKISARLVKRLLTDIGDNQDQLPILQHAMMRTWDYWVANHEPGEPMDIRHYNAVGKISQALSIHANEAYEELSSDEKQIAEILFKSITEKSQENQGLRRSCQISLVAELADVADQDVIHVVEQFRKPGRSFLMPGAHVPLTGDSVVELSHESLMRIWTRLSGWVEEEFESAQMYKRLSEAAAMYQIGKTSLWRPPDLQLALNWQKKQKPTRTWAQRYDIAFERAIVFLDTSRITYEAELKNQEMLQRRMLRRARATNLVLGLFLIVAIAFFFYGLVQQLDAERQALRAEESAKQALAAKDDAELQKKEAERQTQLAKQRLEEVTRTQQSLRVALAQAKAANAEAEKNLALAKEQTEKAMRATEDAETQKEIAELQTDRAVGALKESRRLLILSIAQSMEAKSVGIDDAQLGGLLAMQGYLFHTQNDGKKYDPYVFSGLYYALAKLNGFNYNAVKTPGTVRNKMFALAVASSTNTFYTTGNDGRIFQGDVEKGNLQSVSSNPYPNRVLALSRDERYLVNGSDSSFMQVFDLKGGRPREVRGHKSFVNDIKFLASGSFVSASADRTLRVTNPETGQSQQLVSLPHNLKSIDISPDSKLVVGVSTAGAVVMVNLETKSAEVILDEAPNRVLSVAWHPTRNLIAYGVEILDDKRQVVRGTVKLYDLTSKKFKELGGHKSGISDLKFSPDGLLLASAGLDRKLQMWVVDHEEDLPILMDNNNGNIWDIAFAKGSKFLLASCNSGEIRVWPTDPRMLAEQVCPNLKRNMTPEEWATYVGNGLDYETTCRSLLISDF